MKKVILNFLLIIILILTSFTIFLSYKGLKTDKFNNSIKSKANEINKYVKLDFNKIKIYLNIRQMGLLIKLQDPYVKVKDNRIDIAKLDLFLSLRSLYSSDFLLKKANIGFKNNNIKDISKITNLFLPKLINNQLNNIFISGVVDGEFLIPFQKNGSISKDYQFFGKIINASIKLKDGFIIKNLTSEINYINGDDIKNFSTTVSKGSLLNIKLNGSSIDLKYKNNKETNIQSLLQTKGDLDFDKIKKISNLLNIKIKKIKNINGKIDLKTSINLELSRRFKIKYLNFSVNGNMPFVDIQTVQINEIREFLPEYKDKIELKNVNLDFEKSDNSQIIELKGLFKINEIFESFDIKDKFIFKNKKHEIKGIFNLNNSKINIPQLNYKKQNISETEFKFDLNFILEKYYNVNNLYFSENKTLISFSELKLNNKFEVEDFKKIKIKTFLDDNLNNDFLVDKSKAIKVAGKIFDAEPLLKSILKSNNKETFSKNLNSEIEVNFSKTLTGTYDDITSFAMVASINKGSFDRLVLKGDFSSNEIIEMSIYKIDDDRKTLQIISDRARPFVKNFDFIEGFEGGKLEYESNISKEVTSSNLTINDFKVSKVPALAKLLTLASLQGIADTLTGEGIRFDTFEMKTNSIGNVLNIEDALAMGPAVSILLDGYVDKGKIVSLRGTLVPASKLNSIISKIPLVGDILVGKKTGEGVVGVSFKMKGPPKEIKTSVNPIKTLTPRFIVRAVEKMKKQN